MKASDQKLWSDLFESIEASDSAKFAAILDTNRAHLTQIKSSTTTTFVDDILFKCLRVAEQQQCHQQQHALVELLMQRLHSAKSNFIGCDDTCKIMLKFYTGHNLKLSKHSLGFLLRCSDLECVRSVLDNELIDSPPPDTFRADGGDTGFDNRANWDTMFMVSYQDRLTNSLASLYSGFLSRSLLVYRLRCPRSHNRAFLTWFAGSLHLCIDESFMHNERPLFKFALFKIFEALVLNGLLDHAKFTSLINMIVSNHLEAMDIVCSRKRVLGVSAANGSSTADESPLEKMNGYFAELRAICPLSLKSLARVTIKHSLKSYSRASVEQLHLPAYLKRFVLFEAECESIYAGSRLAKSGESVL
jgi:hypothetical protein